jgi:hypothetical protein
MTGETADQRTRMLSYARDFARRRAERGEGNFFGRKPKPQQ